MEKILCPSCFREYEGAVCPHCGGAQNAPHQLPVGTLLRDRYQLGRVLGQGGFGITYLAWDTLMQKPLAVKEFYPSGIVFRRTHISTEVQCDDQAMAPHFAYSKERFLREANALVKFKDIPEVVDILDFLKENNTAYIVMEYVRGVDLAKYIQRKGGRLSVEETFRILKPVMEALAKVHKGGIVHRDISPDNIILDPMGGAKLLDFGAVRAVEDPDVDKGLNKSTEAILKQGFAPIEQYNSRGSLGPWTDEYAMCATVWYCLTGRVPEEASIRMAEGIDPDWSTIEGLPEQQQKALQKGFSCRAKDRYRSLDELLADLFPEEKSEKPAEEQPAVTEKPAEKAPAKPAKKPAEKKKKPFIWMAAAVAALALIGGFFLLSGKEEDSSPAQLQDAPGTSAPDAPDQTVPNIPETVPTTVPMTEEEKSYLQAEQLLAEGKLGEAAIAFGKLAGYADARERSFEIWDKIAVRDTVSASGWHTVGLRADGTVVAVGDNDDGQCDVDGWTDIVAISAGFMHTVSLRTDGTVVAVGLNTDGQCDVSGWTDIVAVSAGYHTVGLRADGTVIAVGSNEYGQRDVEDWTDITAVIASPYHTVGLRADGTVVAVGNNEDGQCDVDGWTDIVAVSAGYTHTVGLRADGTAVAVGRNDDGQCDVEGWTDIVAVSVGSSHTVGLRADRTVVAVGNNEDGQCDVDGWTDIVAISAGYWHTVGLKADGTVVAVGNKVDGQCNVGNWTDIRISQRVNWYAPKDTPDETTPPGEEDGANAEAYANAEKLLAEGKLGEAAIAFGKLSGYADARERSFEIWDKIAVRDTVSAGGSHTMGLRTDGTVVAVGWNLYGQCDVEDWTDIVAVSAGNLHTVSLRTDGTVVAVGLSEEGQCDVEDWTDIVAVSTGNYRTVGLRADGTVVTVGWNRDGACNVEDWTDIVAVSGGDWHTVGLRADGTVVAVGDNVDGQCDLSGWTDIVAVSAGQYHTVGLRADGTVVAVGNNEDGQCNVEDWTDIVAVSAGYRYTVGLRADGTVVAVGDNEYGQCDIESWTDIVAISAGTWHTVGLRADDTVVAVGNNSQGEIGMALWTPWTDIQLPKERVPFR